MKTTRLFKAFFQSEKSGGILLIVCTVLSLLIANSNWGTDYHHLWSTKLASRSVEFWINDGLMTIFFLLIGLELEREIYIGELSNVKDALLPSFAAIGGMLVPAAFFLSLNYGTATQSGAGIPMATDIAFALGILSLLGKRVPNALKVFLTALAVMDDLGAILVIAFFYTAHISWVYLFTALGIFSVLLILNRCKVHHLLPYLLGGVVMWYCMLQSGVHATITGVLLAFAIPFGKGDEKSISYRLQNFLHAPVAFVILPLFALANTAINISGDAINFNEAHHMTGIALGLVLGKPMGIFLFTYLAVQLGWCSLHPDLKWKNIFGVGLLGGIGFTMSIFIALLAFTDVAIINQSKLAILISSLAAALMGLVFLHFNLKNKTEEE